MYGFRGESGQAYSDILSPLSAWCAVADPLAPARDYGLGSLHVEATSSMFYT